MAAGGRGVGGERPGTRLHPRPSLLGSGEGVWARTQRGGDPAWESQIQPPVQGPEW